MTPFLYAEFDAPVVAQGSHLDNTPVAHPSGKTRRGNREVNNRPPGLSPECHFPTSVEHNQVVSDDYLINQYSPPIYTSFSPTGRLAIDVTRNMGSSNSLAEALLKEVNLNLDDFEGIVRGEVAAVHTHTCHLYPSESRVGPRKVSSAIIGVLYNPSPP